MPVKLYSPPRPPTLRTVLRRAGAILALILFATTVVWFEGGLRDSQTGTHPTFLNAFYYMVVTVTTVGYGDIVPVSTISRLTDIILLTPIRFIVIFTFLGTAYQFVVQRLQEDFRMQRMVDKLNHHTIVCGFDPTGEAAVREMLVQGTAKDQIVVVADNIDCLARADELGVGAVKGDPSRETTLQAVAIERARHALVCPGRDDAAALVCLTLRHLHEGLNIVAMCVESENVKLLERSGADTVIQPAVAGGIIMATATRRPHLVETIQELLSMSGTIHLEERTVSSEQAGKHPRELSGMAVVRVYRAGVAHDLPGLPVLERGDIIVFVDHQ